MKRKIFLSIVTLIIGGVAGYFTQQWKERAIPILQIASVSFERIEKSDLQISINDNLQTKSSESTWFKTLKNEESYSQIANLIKTDLSETVDALGHMTSDLPKMRNYLQQNQDDLSVGQAKEYRKFYMQNIDPLSMTYLTMNIQGLISRQESSFELTDGLNLIPGLTSPEMTFGDIDKEQDKIEERCAMIAVRMVTDWYPNDLLKALDIIIERIGEQATINRAILDGLNGLLQDNFINLVNDYLLVNASISNNGSKTISFQKYGVVSLSVMKEPIFLKAIDTKLGIIIPQGATQEIRFKSCEALSPDLSKKLKTMYNTDFIKCKMAMRLLTTSNFSSEWSYSQTTNLSLFNQKLESEYKEHAPKIGNGT